MSDCEKMRARIPWYVNGTLPQEEARALAEHLSSCPACREILAEAVILSFKVKDAISRMPRAPERIRERLLPRGEIPLGRVDLGSFLLGLSLGLSVKGTKVPVQGNLRLFGRKVRLFKIEGGRK